MEVKSLLPYVDHTLLRQTATWSEIKALLDEAIEFECASACIPASYVAAAAEYVAGRIPVCTVIGFPNGYATTAAKVFMTEDAIRNGASEIDMVVNLGWVRDGLFDRVTDEISQIKKACGEHILKVIVETSLLTRDEKIALCKAVGDGGADFIKTSTGFAGGGATVEDVSLFREHVPAGVKIKASGGIKTTDDAAALIEAGAKRLGTSRLIAIARESL